MTRSYASSPRRPGCSVRVTGLRQVTADVARLPSNGALEHTDRLIYDVVACGGALRAEADGTTDQVEWAGPDDRPLMPFTALCWAVRWSTAGVDGRRTGHPGSYVPRRVQRFGAYAVATDPAGRILLTRIAPALSRRRPLAPARRRHRPRRDARAGAWPANWSRRPPSTAGSPVCSAPRTATIRRRSGPRACRMDWHVIRVLFRVQVDTPTEAEVTEAAGGSTEAAALVQRRRGGPAGAHRDHPGGSTRARG